MLLVVAFFVLALPQQSSDAPDSVEFNPTSSTVIVIGPSSDAVDSLGSNDDAFAEAYADFTYYPGKVTRHLKANNILLSGANAHVIRIRSVGGGITRIVRGNFIDADGNYHQMGLILTGPGRSPLVLYGVDTDSGYIERINKFYRIP
jgi:hypothetical protein